jgi:hypothetical protein
MFGKFLKEKLYNPYSAPNSFFIVIKLKEDEIRGTCTNTRRRNACILVRIRAGKKK